MADAAAAQLGIDIDGDEPAKHRSLATLFSGNRKSGEAAGLIFGKNADIARIFQEVQQLRLRPGDAGSEAGLIQRVEVREVVRRDSTQREGHRLSSRILHGVAGWCRCFFGGLHDHAAVERCSRQTAARARRPNARSIRRSTMSRIRREDRRRR